MANELERSIKAKDSHSIGAYEIKPLLYGLRHADRRTNGVNSAWQLLQQAFSALGWLLLSKVFI